MEDPAFLDDPDFNAGCYAIEIPLMCNMDLIHIDLKAEDTYFNRFDSSALNFKRNDKLGNIMNVMVSGRNIKQVFTTPVLSVADYHTCTATGDLKWAGYNSQYAATSIHGAKRTLPLQCSSHVESRKFMEWTRGVVIDFMRLMRLADEWKHLVARMKEKNTLAEKELKKCKTEEKGDMEEALIVGDGGHMCVTPLPKQCYQRSLSENDDSRPSLQYPPLPTELSKVVISFHQKVVQSFRDAKDKNDGRLPATDLSTPLAKRLFRKGFIMQDLPFYCANGSRLNLAALSFPVLRPGYKVIAEFTVEVFINKAPSPFCPIPMCRLRFALESVRIVEFIETIPMPIRAVKPIAGGVNDSCAVTEADLKTLTPLILGYVVNNADVVSNKEMRKHESMLMAAMMIAEAVDRGYSKRPALPSSDDGKYPALTHKPEDARKTDNNSPSTEHAEDEEPTSTGTAADDDGFLRNTESKQSDEVGTEGTKVDYADVPSQPPRRSLKRKQDTTKTSHQNSHHKTGKKKKLSE